jgi:nudix motif 8
MTIYTCSNTPVSRTTQSTTFPIYTPHYRSFASHSHPFASSDEVHAVADEDLDEDGNFEAELSHSPIQQRRDKHRYDHHQRVWKSASSADTTNIESGISEPLPNALSVSSTPWTTRTMDLLQENNPSIVTQLHQIEQQESKGGRLRSRLLGVLHPDPVVDMQLLTHNYTVPALASALREREEALQQAAILAEQEDYKSLRQFLRIFHPQLVMQRRIDRRKANIIKRLDPAGLDRMRKALTRLPRTVVSAHASRAGIVIPLCTINGVPSLLLEKRAAHLRAHADEVCFPGGMVCESSDHSIVATCMREMKEEIGGLDDDTSDSALASGMSGTNSSIQVLGVFRCNWGEVHHLVGVAVTPVVCYLGELPDQLRPNPDEVSEVFTVPLENLMDKSMWVHKDEMAPIFLGAPHLIWGLTAYILDRFWKEILLPNATIEADSEDLDIPSQSAR